MWLKAILSRLGLTRVSIDHSWDLPSFCVVTDEERAADNKRSYMDEQAARLRKICETVVCDKSLAPVDGRTYCNIAVHRIARQFSNYSEFEGLLANEICDLLEKSSRWAKVTGEWAAEYASGGGLAVAGQKEKEHGHVVVVYPSVKLIKSPSWGKFVPMLANVGKTNDIMPASKCFQKEPEYYVLKA